MPYPRARVLLAVVGAALLAGCGGGAVTVQPWQPAPVAATCARLAAALPAELDVGNRRLATRDVDGVPAGAVARSWGDPPVVLRCGVPRPPEYRPDDVLLTVDGVDWLDVAGEGGRKRSRRDVTSSALGSERYGERMPTPSDPIRARKSGGKVSVRVYVLLGDHRERGRVLHHRREVRVAPPRGLRRAHDLRPRPGREPRPG